MISRHGLPQFTGPRLKIERAEHHIQDLAEKVSLFAASSIYMLRIYRDSHTSEERLELEITQLTPPRLSVILGDALHNLKAALDFTVNEVVFRRLNRYDSHTRFPVRENREKFEAAINGGLIKQASLSVVDFISNRIKPYPGGNDAIWALHDLNIIDKHRVLLPVMGVSLIRGICIKHSQGVFAMPEWVVTRKRSASYRLRGLSKCEVENHGNATATIFFDNGLPFEGQPIIPTLHQLAELVSGIVEGIENVFFAEDEA